MRSLRLYFFDWGNIRTKLFIMLVIAVILLTGGVLFSNNGEPVFYNQPVYQGSSRFKEVALTVNVYWGEEYISQMLDIMRRNDVKATFFLGGIWVKKNPELAARIAGEGHEIGSHGYSHPHPDQLSRSENLKEIQKAEDVIYQATGVKPTLFAPPYGERGPAVLQAADEAAYTTILWSIDTIDWQLPPPEVIVQRVVSRSHNGAIVLMHPTAPTVKALPEIIQKLKEKGYHLETVSKLLKNIEATDTSVQGQKVRI
jgi:probable sporulation protein (polysaccharide deacetylase family)